MDSSNLSRLRQEQERALTDTDLEINKWERFRSDYEALHQRLTTLPDKVSHDVMVPFGSLAFMPGRLVHTNEIMVLLGDNWFVERSAKQAAEIVTRRLNSVKANLSQFEEQRRLLTPRQVFTQQLEEMTQGSSGVKEITEPYDSDTEREWRVQHKKSVKAYREKLRKEQDNLTSSKEENPPNVKSDEELWARLDALEKREAERNELDSDCSELNDDESDQKQKNLDSRHVSWADREVTEESDTESDDIEESTSAGDYDTDTEEESRTPRITFTHSNQNKAPSPETTADSVSNSSDPVPNINSPSDIYKYFVQPSQPKSILKQKKEKHKVEEERKQAEQRRTADSAIREQAFTGTVVEKPVTSSASVVKVTETSTAATVPAPSYTEPTSTRPVSRFKAQRQQRGGIR